MARRLVRGGYPILLKHVLCLRKLLFVVLAGSLDVGLNLLVRHEFLYL